MESCPGLHAGQDLSRFQASLTGQGDEDGVYYALGGTGAIVAGLDRLITKLGGQIHRNTEVAKITPRAGA